MIRAFVVSSVLVAGAAAADPQPQPMPQYPYQETVTLQGYTPNGNYYDANVNVHAALCDGTVYNVNLEAPGSKDADDAKAKVKAEVDKIIEDIRKAAAVACNASRH